MPPQVSTYATVGWRNTVPVNRVTRCAR